MESTATSIGVLGKELSIPVQGRNVRVLPTLVFPIQDDMNACCKAMGFDQVFSIYSPVSDPLPTLELKDLPGQIAFRELVKDKVLEAHLFLMNLSTSTTRAAFETLVQRHTSNQATDLSRWVNSSFKLPTSLIWQQRRVMPSASFGQWPWRSSFGVPAEGASSQHFSPIQCRAGSALRAAQLALSLASCCSRARLMVSRSQPVQGCYLADIAKLAPSPPSPLLNAACKTVDCAQLTAHPDVIAPENPGPSRCLIPS